MDEDWDLHALVRGSTAATNLNTVQGPFTITTDFIEEYDYEDPFCFPNLCGPRNNYNPFEELEQMYKPYFPNTNLAAPSVSSSISNLCKFSVPNPQSHPKSIVNPSVSSNFGPRSKRRKNQQKRVVKQVTAADLVSDDIWAWRKYGQKPIKGSLYPRNYYRCSSSKGCLARKQVEKSDSDPNMFIITYTGEHSHPRPTHRNTLAGSTRNKHSTTTVATQEKSEQNPLTNLKSPILSPKTPLIPELLQSDKINGCDEEDEDEEIDGEDILIPNMTMNEDIFMGLHELKHH